MGLPVNILASAARDIDRHLFAPGMTAQKRLAFNETLKRTSSWISDYYPAGTPIVRVVDSDLVELIPILKHLHYKGLMDYPHKPNYKILYLVLPNMVDVVRIASDNEEIAGLLFAKFVGTTVQ